jgi:hypothetical protein
MVVSHWVYAVLFFSAVAFPAQPGTPPVSDGLPLCGAVPCPALRALWVFQQVNPCAASSTDRRCLVSGCGFGSICVRPEGTFGEGACLFPSTTVGCQGSCPRVQTRSVDGTSFYATATTCQSGLVCDVTEGNVIYTCGGTADADSRPIGCSSLLRADGLCL